MIIYGHHKREARYLILGEAPNRQLAGLEHLCWIPDGSRKRHSANRLHDLAGNPGIGRWLRTFDRSNIFDECQPRAGKGDCFSVQRGRSELSTGWPMVVSRCYDGILAMGSRVASCLSWMDEHGRPTSVGRVPLLEWRMAMPHHSTTTGLGERTPMACAVVPHPSGVNRWYNEASNRRLSSNFLQQIFSETQP